jgi:phage terminase
METPAHFGTTEPRLWTRPLRELTRESSRGFEVIDFAREILGVELYPWQKWLLIHGLELLDDDTYRFRQVIVLVARQNGKTMLATVLAAWWLFIESRRRPDKVPPAKFKIVGTAQNLDIAKEPWSAVKAWCNPAPDTPEEADLAIGALQRETAKVRDTNGDNRVIARNRAHYEIRAVSSARGKPAARVLMDEMREQKKWAAWNAVAPTNRSFWSGQLWGISNAGDSSAVVLKELRARCLTLIAQWKEAVEVGGVSPQAYAENPEHDTSLGLFEWSAPDECVLEDVAGILQANPSIGYSNISVAQCLAEARSSQTNEAGYRTEVLCQWVPELTHTYIQSKDYREIVLSPGEVEALTVRGARTVWGVDTSTDRSMTYVAAATTLADGRAFTTIWSQRAGMLWLVDYLVDLAEESGIWEVALQSRGCPAMEFVKPLEDRGFTVHRIDGGTIGVATGRFKDAVRDRRVVTIDQDPMRLAIEGGVTAKYAENDAWSRTRSVTDVAPAIAQTVALYGLEMCEPEDEAPVSPPPPAAVVSRSRTGDPAGGRVNIATMNF